MRVSARFNERGLELVLQPENDAEKRMIGAVLNQPFEDTNYHHEPELDAGLVTATIHYEGHWSNKSISSLSLRVLRQESSGGERLTRSS